MRTFADGREATEKNCDGYADLASTRSPGCAAQTVATWTVGVPSPGSRVDKARVRSLAGRRDRRARCPLRASAAVSGSDARAPRSLLAKPGPRSAGARPGL